MTGALILVALVAAVLAVFVHLVRRRVRATLERAGHELPEELVRSGAAARKPAPIASAQPAVGSRGSAAAAHFVLVYDVATDFMQRRGQYRDQHLALAWKAADAGELVLAGALEPPTTQAFLLFRGSREAAIRFAEADPYVRQGLVRHWSVRQWHTTVGASAATPLRPKA